MTSIRGACLVVVLDRGSIREDEDEDEKENT